MAEDIELQRLAAGVNQLRPEWPVKSLLTMLRGRHATRAYRDLAVALVWVATDPGSKTPARLDEAGPWWQATAASESGLVARPTMCGDHPAQKAAACSDCDLQQATDVAARAAQVRAELARAPRLHATPTRKKAS